MIINEVLAQLENAGAPVIKVLQVHAAGKTLVLGFKAGMILKEHRTAVPASLLVIGGAVIYKQEGTAIPLRKYADLEIPVDVLHAVEAVEDSICLLLVAKPAI